MIRDIEDVIKKEIEQQLLIEEALAQAESASRAKGKFLSDMSARNQDTYECDSWICLNCTE